MIRPDTPPGTEIVCIDDSPGRYGPSGLVKGGIYTVNSIEQGLDKEPLVIVYEVTPTVAFEPPYGMLNLGFLLSRFRYLDLPPCLTELLKTTRIPSDLETT